MGLLYKVSALFMYRGEAGILISAYIAFPNKWDRKQSVLYNAHRTTDTFLRDCQLKWL